MFPIGFPNVSGATSSSGTNAAVGLDAVADRHSGLLLPSDGTAFANGGGQRQLW